MFNNSGRSRKRRIWAFHPLWSPTYSQTFVFQTFDNYDYYHPFSSPQAPSLSIHLFFLPSLWAERGLMSSPVLMTWLIWDGLVCSLCARVFVRLHLATRTQTHAVILTRLSQSKQLVSIILRCSCMRLLLVPQKSQSRVRRKQKSSAPWFMIEFCVAFGERLSGCSLRRCCIFLDDLRWDWGRATEETCCLWFNHTSTLSHPWIQWR